MSAPQNGSQYASPPKMPLMSLATTSVASGSGYRCQSANPKKSSLGGRSLADTTATYVLNGSRSGADDRSCNSRNDIAKLIDSSRHDTAIFSDSRNDPGNLSYTDSENSTILYDSKEMKRLQESINPSRSKESKISSRVLKRLVRREVEMYGAEAGVSLETVLLSDPSQSCTKSTVGLEESQNFCTVVPVERSPQHDLGVGVGVENHSLSSIDEEDEEEENESELALPVGPSSGTPVATQNSISRMAKWLTRRRGGSETEDNHNKPSSTKDINTYDSYKDFSVYDSCSGNYPGEADSPRSQHDSECSEEQLVNTDGEKQRAMKSVLCIFGEKESGEETEFGREMYPKELTTSLRVDHCGQVRQHDLQSDNLNIGSPVWYTEDTDQAYGLVGIGRGGIGSSAPAASSPSVSSVETPLLSLPPPGKRQKSFLVGGKSRPIISPAQALSGRNTSALRPIPANTVARSSRSGGLEKDQHSVVLESEFSAYDLEWGNHS